jgi:5-hydroxyisourate hydrolase-like protein (transthyretin family)
VAVGLLCSPLRERLAHDCDMISGLEWVKYAVLIALAAGLTGFLVYFAGFGNQAPGHTAASGQDQASVVPADAATMEPPKITAGEAPPDAHPPGDPGLEAGSADTVFAPNPIDAAPEPESEPQGPFSVSGMVVDEAGIGVGGIEIVSRLKHAFDTDEASGGAESADVRTVLTDIDGFYEIRGVADGEYRIQAEPTDRYEAASAVVRAGSETADLVLRARRPEILVFGTVRSEGAPLDGVEVQVVGQPVEAAPTDSNGRYELELEVVGGKRAYTLRFVREGYRESRMPVDSLESARQSEIRVDAEMEPVRELVDVSGAVLSRDGKPVPDQSVQIYSESARQRYTAVSRQDGKFWLEDVEASSDYLLTVYPEEKWRDYKRYGVEIALGGADLEVVLEPLALGRLSGQMVDSEGQPVPRFSLWLRNPGAVNRGASLVTGDQQGFFSVDEVEAGDLLLETRSSPLFSISGIRLTEREEKSVRLVLDWGSHQVSGLVMDEGGLPLPATELFVTSLRRDNGLRAHAVRRAVTDESGFFLVNQVGAGYHTIRVAAPGFLTAVLDHEVGKDAPEVIIRLQRASAHGM